MKVLALGFFAWGSLCAQSSGLDLLNHNRPLLDTHNGYPYAGKWNDRLDRALSAGYQVGIEQDLAWGIDKTTGNGRPVLSHSKDTTGGEATLRDIFFEHVRPPAGAKHRLFRSHTAAVPATSREERTHLAAIVPPEKLLTEGPTNYRRWWNNSWFVVEEGGQAKAGDWTAADDLRLRALVDHDQGYNFGSSKAASLRWKAAVAAGVNLIANDQFEDLAKVLQGSQK